MCSKNPQDIGDHTKWVWNSTATVLLAGLVWRRRMESEYF